MTITRGALCSATVLAALVSGAGLAQACEPPVQSSPQSSVPKAPAMPMALSSLAGEWDGVVTLRQAQGASSSIASMSVRAEADGSLLAAFDGFERGEPFEGMLRLRMNADTKRVAMRSFSTALNAVAESELAGEVNATAMAFRGQLTPAGAKPVPMQHLVRVIQPDHVVIEWALVSGDGSPNVVMTLDMSKLPEGRRATAADLMPSPVLLAQMGVPPSMTASAPGD